jgi:Prokaryotic homologs of the JAB domain
LKKTGIIPNEESGILVGSRRGNVWLGRLQRRRHGGPSSVDFDWAWVLEREERRGDVIGFWHTHPFGFDGPSRRDIRTMQGWVSCLGKPLLCLIQGRDSLVAHFFQTDEDSGRRLAEAHRFERGLMVIIGR